MKKTSGLKQYRFSLANARAMTGAALGILLLTAAAPQTVRAQQVVANGTTKTASGTINTGTAGSTAGYALWASNGGIITSTDALTLITGGYSAYGVVAQSGGQVTINSAPSSITTSGSYAYGIYAADANSVVTAADTAIKPVGTNGTGVYVWKGAQVHLTRGSVTVPSVGNGAAALLAWNGGAGYGNGKISASGVTIQAGGLNGMGVQTNSGGSIDLTGGSVATTGNGGHGLYTIGTGPALTANGTSVLTQGNDACGAYMLAGGMQLTGVDIVTQGVGSTGAWVDNASSLTIEGGSITTHGGSSADQAIGAIAIAASTLTASNTAIATTGDGGPGAASEFGAQMVLNGGSVTTTGGGAVGLFSVGLSGATGAALTANGVQVQTSGAGSHSAIVRGGSSLTIQNGSSVSATGAGAAGLYASAYDTNPSTATVTGSALKSGQSVGIYVTGTTLNASLTGSSLEGAAAAWTAMSNASAVPGILNLSADAATLTGAGTKDAASTSNVSLKNGSAWNMTGNSSVSSLGNDASVITFTAPAAGASYKTLTAGSYASSGGTIVMNASLGADSAPADLLVVAGQPTGTTLLRVRNTDGAGAATTGDGILLVQTGTPASANAFVLDASPVRAGGYGYALFQGDASGGQMENWYLRSQKERTLPPTAGGATSVPALNAPALALLAFMLAALGVWRRRRA